MDAQVLGAFLAFVSAAALFFLGKYLERRSVNKGILAEVDRLLQVIRRHESWWSGCIRRMELPSTLIPFSTDIYDKLAENIGMIDSDHVAQVVKFLGYVKFLNSYQKSQPAKGDPELDKFANGYLFSLQTCLADYEGEFDEAFARYDIA